MSTMKVTDQSFESDVLKAGQPVLVDFWAEWCGPCKQIAPALEDVAKDMTGKLTVAKLNIDENPATPQKYRVQGIPTLMLFKDGQVDRLVVTDEEVLVVDYKSNRQPPGEVGDVAPVYVAQMALYRALLQQVWPGRRVRCALLWTESARLMELPEAALENARVNALDR